MTIWEKISSAVTGISAFAAMIAAVVAMKQATKADEQYQILMEEYLPNMEFHNGTTQNNWDKGKYNGCLHRRR